MRLETTLVGSNEANQFLQRVRANTSVKAVAKSIDDTVKQGRTTLAKELINRLNLPPNYIKKTKGGPIRQIKTKSGKGNQSRTVLSGALTVRKRKISAFRFLPKNVQTKVRRELTKKPNTNSKRRFKRNIPFRDQPGVSVAFRKGASPKLFAGSFVLSSKYKSKTGRPNFLIGTRKGRERLPIDTLLGESIFSVANDQKIFNQVKQVYKTKFPQRFKFWTEELYAREIAKLKRRGKITVR